LKGIHLSLVRIHFRELIEATADIAHLDLVDLAAPAQISTNREHFTGRILQSFGYRTQAQLESIRRLSTIDSYRLKPSKMEGESRFSAP